MPCLNHLPETSKDRFTTTKILTTKLLQTLRTLKSSFLDL